MRGMGTEAPSCDRFEVDDLGGFGWADEGDEAGGLG